MNGIFVRERLILRKGSLKNLIVEEKTPSTSRRLNSRKSLKNRYDNKIIGKSDTEKCHKKDIIFHTYELPNCVQQGQWHLHRSRIGIAKT